MKKLLLFLTTFLALIILIPAVSMATNQSVYTVAVDIEERSDSAVDQALPAALDKILIRISGQSSATAGGAYYNELKSWVERYGFSTEWRLRADGSHYKQIQAVISLTATKVDQARTALGLPLWTGKRPEIALWVALDENGERIYLPEGAEYARNTLEAVAGTRAVKISLPAVELEGEVLDDAPALADIWGGFPEQMLPNAIALGADAVLLAAASHRNSNWKIRWNLLSNKTNGNFISSAPELEDALADGLNQVIDSLAALESIDIADQGYWKESIDIIHLPDAQAYRQLIDELNQHRLIDSVQVDSVAGQRLRLVLEMNASPAIVWAELATNPHLSLVGTGVAGVAVVFDFALPDNFPVESVE